MRVRIWVWVPTGNFPLQRLSRAMVLVGTLGKHQRMLDIDQDDNVWIVMWVTHSRPLGVRVLPVSKGNFYDPAFNAKKWTMVVYWDELEDHRTTAGRTTR